MPDEDAKVDSQMHCTSREDISTLEHEQKPLLSTDEPSATNVCSKNSSSADPDTLPQLVCEPVNGLKPQNKLENISESLFSPLVNTAKVCTLSNDECKHKMLATSTYTGGSCETQNGEGLKSPTKVPVTCPIHNFFLPTEEDIDDDETIGASNDINVGDCAVVSPVVGMAQRAGDSAPTCPTLHQMHPAVSRVGVQLQGTRHVFTIVPVASSELHHEPEKDKVPEIVSLPIAITTTTQCVSTVSSYCPQPPTLATVGGVPQSHYNTVRGLPIARRPVYNPYQTMTGPGSGAGLYNPYMTGTTMGVPPYNPYQTVTGACMGGALYHPYHTITGMVPSSYEHSDASLQRIPTFSRREYGIGGSSMLQAKPEFRTGDIPPSLASVVLPRSPMPSPKSSTGTLIKGIGVRPMGIHRVRTMPASMPVPNHLSLRQSGGQQYGGQPPPPLSPEQVTVQSINQMTVRSAGGLSVDVGSTDGRNVTVRGAVVSPEQLPFLPPLFRAGQEDDGGQGRDGVEPRQTWGNKAQFVLACIGYAVGLGNLWRFPYLCYKSGGGAFLIPYFLMLFLCGIPLLLMELAVGQYTRRGPVAALEKICPLFKGAGVGTVVISFLLCTYYNVIIAWVIFYLVQSFTSELPWSNCNATWAVNCFDSYGSDVEAPNGTKSPTEEFFDEVVLQKSKGIGEMGSMRVELLLALFGAWALVYFSLWKSVKSSGRVVYVTATLPYLLIGAFLWRALSLPGANIGLKYFFNPRWELLLDAQVWVNAAAQNFNSIGIAFGSLIAFSSYNKFNNNIIVDTWAISLTNSFTSLLAGMIVFSTLGNIALEQNKEIDDVVAEGPGLVFMVYPQALAKMPYANVWAILFFIMLLILGLDSQFASVEVIITSLQDGFPKWIKKHLKRHEVLVLIVCFISFLCGLPNIMQGGIYFFQLIDYYAAAVSLMYLALFEVVAITWAYGAGRLARNVREMTGRLPSRYFRFCWYFASPLLILAIWIFSMVDYKRPTYNKGEYKYPDWAIGVGWTIAAFSIVPIPIFAVIAVIRAKGTTFIEKLKNSIRSQIDECPCCGRAFNCLDEAHTHGNECLDNQVKLVVYNPEEYNRNKSAVTTNDNTGDITETKSNGENAI